MPIAQETRYMWIRINTCNQENVIYDEVHDFLSHGRDITGIRNNQISLSEGVSHVNSTAYFNTCRHFTELTVSSNQFITENFQTTTETFFFLVKYNEV